MKKNKKTLNMSLKSKLAQKKIGSCGIKTLEIFAFLLLVWYHKYNIFSHKKSRPLGVVIYFIVILGVFSEGINYNKRKLVLVPRLWDKFKFKLETKRENNPVAAGQILRSQSLPSRRHGYVSLGIN